MIEASCDRCGTSSAFCHEDHHSGGGYCWRLPTGWVRVPDHVDVIDNTGDTCAHLCPRCAGDVGLTK